MSDTYHVDHTTIDPFLAKLFRAAFPSYAGRMFKIDTLRPSDDGQCRMDLRSYWDGGSRDYYALVRLSDFARLQMPAQSAFDRPIVGADAAIIPPGVVVVEHTIFCGKDLGLTVHVRPEDRNPAMLPPVVTLTDDQRFVLGTIAGTKSSYRDEARQRYGMPRSVWESAKAELVAAGHLNKAGAITPAGRNAIGTWREPSYTARWQPQTPAGWTSIDTSTL